MATIVGLLRLRGSAALVCTIAVLAMVATMVPLTDVLALPPALIAAFLLSAAIATAPIASIRSIVTAIAVVSTVAAIAAVSTVAAIAMVSMVAVTTAMTTVAATVTRATRAAAVARAATGPRAGTAAGIAATIAVPAAILRGSAAGAAARTCASHARSATGTPRLTGEPSARRTRPTVGTEAGASVVAAVIPAAAHFRTRPALVVAVDDGVEQLAEAVVRNVRLRVRNRAGTQAQDDHQRRGRSKQRVSIVVSRLLNLLWPCFTLERPISSRDY
jgi:hypothetical protein